VRFSLCSSILRNRRLRLTVYSATRCRCPNPPQPPNPNHSPTSRRSGLWKRDKIGDRRARSDSAGYSSEELRFIDRKHRNLRLWLKRHSPTVNIRSLNSSFPALPHEKDRYTLTLIHDISTATLDELDAVKQLIEYARYAPKDTKPDVYEQHYEEGVVTDKSWLDFNVVTLKGRARKDLIEELLCKGKYRDDGVTMDEREIAWEKKRKACLVMGGDDRIRSIVEDLRCVHRYRYNVSDDFFRSSDKDEEHNSVSVPLVEAVDLVLWCVVSSLLSHFLSLSSPRSPFVAPPATIPTFSTASTPKQPSTTPSTPSSRSSPSSSAPHPALPPTPPRTRFPSAAVRKGRGGNRCHRGSC
jgi:hypothetical protein